MRCCLGLALLHLFELLLDQREHLFWRRTGLELLCNQLLKPLVMRRWCMATRWSIPYLWEDVEVGAKLGQRRL